MQNAMNNMQLSEHEWNILRYLYNKDGNDQNDDVETIAAGLQIERPLARLILAKMMNDGYVSRFITVNNQETYVLSLEGFEYFKSYHRN